MPPSRACGAVRERIASYLSNVLARSPTERKDLAPAPVLSMRAANDFGVTAQPLLGQVRQARLAAPLYPIVRHRPGRARIPI